jgi:hypothetical protein
MGVLDDPPRTGKAQLGKLAALLERSDIDVDDFARVEKVNLWQMGYVDKEGEAQSHDLSGLSLIPHGWDGPEWPVVQQAAPTKIVYGKRPQPKAGSRVTFIYPDQQVGFWFVDNGQDIELIPMHDPVAIACAHNVARLVKPWRTVNLGDALDMSEWSSKFVVYPEFANTTQRSLDYLHADLATQRAIVGPDGEVWLFAGNHDDRLGLAVARNAKAALRLRQANTPESWPVLSMRHLLRLDELGVGYVDGYPAGRKKLADGHGRQAPLYAIHGEKLDMIKVAKAERQSFVQGHTHRVGLDTQTYEIDGQAVEVEAWMLGCLARTDGAVPSTKGAVGDDGRPLVRHESWQHACGVLTEFDDGGWQLEPVRIRDGVAHYRGQEITA